MIAQELEVSLHMAFVEARQKRHEFITVEHLLLALLDNPSATETLRACGGNISVLFSSAITCYRISPRRRTWKFLRFMPAPSAKRALPGPLSCWFGWGWATELNISLRSSPAASSSG